MNKKIDELLKDNTSVLLTSPHNMRYFSNFSGGEGVVLFAGDKKFLFTDSRYTEQAKGEAVGFLVVETNDYLKSACEVLESDNGCRALIEENEISAKDYTRICSMVKNCEFTFGAEKINAQRMVKTETELEKIKKAEEIGCKAFEHILDFIKPGICEKEIATELEYFMKKNGADAIAFETIAISGKRTSLPHGVPGDKKIEKGDFVTMDFGCTVDGYCSDMTRTVVVGKASDEQKKIYNAVRNAQQAALDVICEGIRGCDADKVARDYIERAGYGQYFRHSLGHGVGLLVHELPNLSPKSEIVLSENMVTSCEPGIYIPDFGGVRIEDLVVVRKDGCENLTPATKEIIEL
ncbi:MAG: aminopeptidase P family protein [Clostridia bacterium]|nr:aminopeptidase P family protein [Clostridia bacterium]